MEKDFSLNSFLNKENLDKHCIDFLSSRTANQYTYLYLGFRFFCTVYLKGYVKKS